VTAHDVREVCQVRRALECEATRSACGRVDLAELHDLARELKRLKAAQTRTGQAFIQRARDLDSRLHDLIAESCGNSFLAKELNRLKILFRAFRDISWEHEEARNDYHRLAEEAGEHLTIVEGLLRRARYWSRALPVQPNGAARSLPARNGPSRRTELDDHLLEARPGGCR
jgi:DNA-binding GntR family transcriptional regulator